MSSIFRAGRTPKDRIQVLCDSSQRSEGVIENCIFQLNNTITRLGSYEIYDAQIPYSYYIFNVGNNSLQFNSTTVFIPPLAYTASTLATAILAQIVANVPAMTAPTVTYDTNNNVFIITSTAAFTLYDLADKPNTSTAASTIGFSQTHTSVLSATSDFPIRGPTFTFTGNNQTFIITSPGTTTVTIPPGSYTAPGLASTLTGLLITAGLTTLAVTYNIVNYTFTVTATPSSAFTVKATGTSAKILGFSQDVVASGGVATSNIVANISGSNYIFIRSNTITDIRESKDFVNSAYNNVMHKTVVDVNPGSVINDKQYYKNQINFAANASIQTFDLRLEDSLGNLLNLNGLDWSITLVFTIY